MCVCNQGYFLQNNYCQAISYESGKKGTQILHEMDSAPEMDSAFPVKESFCIHAVCLSHCLLDHSSGCCTFLFFELLNLVLSFRTPNS